MKTAFLSFGGQSEDVVKKVTSSTMRFLQDSFVSPLEYAYTSDDALRDFVQKHGINLVVSDQAIVPSAAALLKSLHIVIVTIGLASQCPEEIDIYIDPLKPPSAHGLTGPAYLLPDILTKAEMQSVASSMDMKLQDFLEEMECGNAKFWLPHIVALVRPLPWDSAFFGYNVGIVSCLRLTPSIQKYVRAYMDENAIVLMQYLCDCHDRTSILVAEASGYSFVDIRLTFARSLTSIPEYVLPDDIECRRATVGDIASLRAIAHDAYRDSRYYFDGNFESERLIQFYQDWIEKAVHGTFDDYAQIVKVGDTVAGFASIKIENSRKARIGLIGLHPDFRGKGLGKYLLFSVLQDLQSKNIQYVTVVTQGRNYSAQKLYQKCGFTTEKTELWYHKWDRSFSGR